MSAQVTPGSGADKAGLQGTSYDQFTGRYQLGDIITGIDGSVVKNYRDLYEVLDQKQVGQTVKIEVMRNRGKQTLSLTLGGRSTLPGSD